MPAKTNDAGRAEFIGLQPGTRVRAATTVDGEWLESQEFAIPRNWRRAHRARGDRCRGGQQQAGSARAGRTGSGPDRHGGARPAVAFRLRDGRRGAECVRRPRDRECGGRSGADRAAGDLPFDLSAARGAGLLDRARRRKPRCRTNGSSSAARSLPDTTSLQFGFSLPIAGASLTLEQSLPLPLGQVSVMAQKVGDMQMESPQVAAHRDMPARRAKRSSSGRARRSAAGQLISFTFSGLPHHPVWPRNLALTLAARDPRRWRLGAALRRGARKQADDGRRQRLDARRDRLFAELMLLEEQHRERRHRPRTLSRRAAGAGAALERVYAELDDEGSRIVVPAWTSVADLHRRLAALRPAPRRSTECRSAARPGRSSALLGANGAGKSTLLSIAATLLAAVRWTSAVRRPRAVAAGAALRARIGVLGHDLFIYPGTVGRREPAFLRAALMASPMSSGR